MMRKLWMGGLALALSLTLARSAYAEGKKKPTYLSMTQSEITENSDFKARNVFFDLQSKKETVTYTYQASAQYQLSLYDRKNKQTYFVIDQESNDNVYVHKGKDQAVTDSFYAVNNLYQANDKLYLIGVKKDETAISPFIYNIKTKRLKRIDKDKNRKASVANFSKNANEFLYATFSDKESEKRSDKFNNSSKNNRILKIPCKVYAVNKKDKKKKLFSTKASIENIAGNKRYILYTTVYYKGWNHDDIEDIKDIRETYLYDRKSKKTKKIKNIPQGKDTEETGIIALSGKKTVLLYESGIAGSKIIEYNISKKKKKTLYSVEGYYISNAAVIS